MFLTRNIHVEQGPSSVSIPVDSDLSGALYYANADTRIGGIVDHVWRFRGSSTNSTGGYSGLGAYWGGGLINSSTFSSNLGTIFPYSRTGTFDSVNFGQAIENIVGAVTLGSFRQLVEFPSPIVIQMEHKDPAPQWYVKFKIHSIAASSTNTVNVRLNSIPTNSLGYELFLGGSSANDFDIHSSDFISGSGSFTDGDIMAIKIKAAP